MTDDENTKKRLGDFEIIRELGRGGMGIVYEARQVSLNRKVALKVISTSLGLSSKAVLRFQREAEAAGKLHHTNIVPIYSTGDAEGTHYYAMELIDGPSLHDVVRSLRSGDGESAQVSDSAATMAVGAEPIPTTSALLKDSSGGVVETPAWVSEILGSPPVSGDSTPTPKSSSRLDSTSLQTSSNYFDTVATMISGVADALDYAHENGVIHRDIKPANMLLSRDGRVSINDFGLARMLEQPGMTMSGEFIGSPLYMSPEQITAGRVPLNHRTDIYSLGATLYELLTLQPPFPGPSRDEVLAQIIHKEPLPPRRQNPKVPADLETICLKAMEKDPDRRYQTAGQLAEDLRRFVNRFAISARRMGPVGRITKWVQRHPTVAALLGCLLIALALVGYFAYQTRLAQNQLRVKHRQVAIDSAVLEAMSGDAESALQAIANAENKGAEAGQLNMLRGLVEHQRGRPSEALVYLEQADKQLSHSVGVKALLAMAYLDDGQFSSFDKMYTLLEKLSPKTSEDYFLLGIAHAETDPIRALRTLDGAPARSRQSTVARLARVSARLSLARMTGRVEDAEQALDDLRKVDPSDNPYLVSTRVYAHLVAAHAYGSSDPRQKDALEQAARYVEQLAMQRDNAIAVKARCYYHFVQRNDQALLQEVRQARENDIESLFTAGMEASVLYGLKRFDDAARALQLTGSGGDQTFWLIFRGITLAANPGRRVEAEKVIMDGIRGCKGGGGLSYVAAYLLLLGPEYRSKAEQTALEIRERKSHLIPNARDRWYHELLAFHAGLISAHGLLKKAGESRFNQCEAYFYIGLRKLAEENRPEAKESFTRCFETGVFFYGEYIWSRAFLAHIDDPDWLQWDPVKDPVDASRK